VLAVALHARANPDGNPSVISQIAASVFGSGSVLFYLFPAATAGILILAANTAFNGFPVLASIVGQHRYLPRQLHNRGDRLVFSNGIRVDRGVYPGVGQEAVVAAPVAQPERAADQGTPAVHAGRGRDQRSLSPRSSQPRLARERVEP
jgi:hypothetical protein